MSKKTKRCNCFESIITDIEDRKIIAHANWDEHVAFTMSGTKYKLNIKGRRYKTDGTPKAKVEKMAVFMSYCPFCGKKMED